MLHHARLLNIANGITGECFEMISGSIMRSIGIWLCWAEVNEHNDNLRPIVAILIKTKFFQACWKHPRQRDRERRSVERLRRLGPAPGHRSPPLRVFDLQAVGKVELRWAALDRSLGWQSRMLQDSKVRWKVQLGNSHRRQLLPSWVRWLRSVAVQEIGSIVSLRKRHLARLVRLYQ